MRVFKFPLLLAVVAVVTSLTSCDTFSSVEYNIHNISSDTVTVSFHEDIMTSPYQGFDIQENDSVTTHYGDSVTVAVLAPNQHLKVYREWHGLYREDRVVPAWRFILSIKVGETVTAPETWNNESAWSSRTKGGGNFSKEESRYYDLWFK